MSHPDNSNIVKYRSCHIQVKHDCSWSTSIQPYRTAEVVRQWLVGFYGDSCQRQLQLNSLINVQCWCWQPGFSLYMQSDKPTAVATANHSYSVHAWHTTNLATGVSRLPVLDCGMTFHPGFGGRDSPSILLDDLWKHISLTTEALVTLSTYRRYTNNFIYLSIYADDVKLYSSYSVNMTSQDATDRLLLWPSQWQLKIIIANEKCLVLCISNHRCTGINSCLHPT